jgi:hypothetical protein
VISVRLVRLAVLFLLAFPTSQAMADPGDAATGHLIRSSDGGLILQIANTGTTQLQFMRLDLKQGYAPSGQPVSSAGGACSQTGANQFGCTGFNLMPGQTMTVKFNTQPAPYPDNGGAVLHVSSKGQTDALSTVDGPSGGGTTPTGPPTTTPQPCECANVDAFLNGFHLASIASTRLSFTVNWTITCTAGNGSGCRGMVKVLAPRGIKFIRQDGKAVPKGTTIASVNCAGPCTKSATGKSELTWLGGRTPKQRAGKKMTLKIQLICIGANGVPKPGRIKPLTIQFKQHGFVDYKNSDLNGDGKADGKQLGGKAATAA